MSKQDIQANILELWIKTNIPLTKAHIQYHSQFNPQQLDSALDALVMEGLLDLESNNDGDLIYIVPSKKRATEGAHTFAEWEKKQALIEEAKRRILNKRKEKTSSQVNSKKPPNSPKAAPPPQTSNSFEPTLSPPHPKEPNPKIKRSEKGSGAEETMALALKNAKAMTSKAFSELDQATSSEAGEKSPVISAALSFFLGPIGWLYAGSFKEAIPAFLIAAGITSLLPSFLLFPLMMVALPASAVGGWLYAWQYNQDGERKPLFLGDGQSEEE